MSFNDEVEAEMKMLKANTTGVTPVDVALAMGMGEGDKAKVGQALVVLAKEGKIYRVSRGVYTYKKPSGSPKKSSLVKDGKVDKSSPEYRALGKHVTKSIDDAMAKKEPVKEEPKTAAQDLEEIVLVIAGSFNLDPDEVRAVIASYYIMQKYNS